MKEDWCNLCAPYSAERTTKWSYVDQPKVSAMEWGKPINPSQREAVVAQITINDRIARRKECKLRSEARTYVE
jgi:hypothetical protein